jgi:hypothetical protein
MMTLLTIGTVNVKTKYNMYWETPIVLPLRYWFSQYICLIVMSHWLVEVWIWIRGISIVLPLSLFRLENRVCLSHGVQVAGAAWRVATRIVAGVGDLVQRTEDGQAQVRYWVTGWSGGWVTPCAVCTVHEEMRSVGFLLEPQNQGRRFISGLASKPLGWFVSDLTSKPLGLFLLVWPQNRRPWFFPVWPQTWWWRVSRFGPQNAQISLMIWASKSPW